MSSFEYLQKDIIALTSQSAKFRRVVLHLHSPESYDFGSTPESDTTLNNKEQYLAPDGEKFFLSHAGHSVDLIAVTDHMRSSYACRLSKWAVDNNHDVKILPGIELNVRLQAPLKNLRLHLIIIFPENKSIGEIERIIPNGYIPSDEKRTGQEELDNIPDLAVFINSIRKDHQGICIAAHVDSKNGIRMLFRQTGKETIALFNPDGKLTKDDERQLSEDFKDFLVKVKFDGIEIAKPENRTHYSWETNPEEGLTYHVPVFLTFDAHNIETLKALSDTKKDRITYVKMADVSWQGLRDAIKFPNTRIRFSDERVLPPYILGMQIVSGTGEGFFSDLKLGFASNLNCLIGARGSGKSTVIDAIRYVFGYNRTLDELGSKDLKDAVKNRQKATLKGSIVRVAYQVNPTDVHIIEATYGGEKADYVTKVYDIDGNLIHIDDVERSGKYPVRLFGWSEIETLGRDPERQMELLDKLVEGLTDFKDNRKAIRSKLRENSQTILAQANKLHEIYNRNDQEIKRYREYKQDFEKYNTVEVEKLFKSVDTARDQKSVLDEFSVVVGAYQSSINILTPIDFEKKLEDDFNKNPDLKIWWNAIKDTQIGLSKSQELVQTNLDAISTTLATILSLTGDLANGLKKQIDQLDEQIRNIVSVDTKQQVLANLRAQSKERLDKVEILREEYNENHSILKGLMTDRQEIIQTLLILHSEISQRRQAKKEDIEYKLNEFQTNDMKVEITLLVDGNTVDLQNKIRDLRYLAEANRTYKADKWPEILANMMTPVQFVKSVLDLTPNSLVANKIIDGVLCSIGDEKALGIIESLSPFKEDQSAGVIDVDLEKLKALMEIEELEWDDKVCILRNGQSVENASPGQRSSAMLPLIALAEKAPLVIDQPEDNLDNRMVGKVLVDILAKLKERRQIIVCTHNPNIVVLGDAEQVIVLDAIDNNHGHAEDIQASIDHPVIIKKVIELMEGGRHAFDTRSKRYGN